MKFIRGRRNYRFARGKTSRRGRKPRRYRLRRFRSRRKALKPQGIFPRKRLVRMKWTCAIPFSATPIPAGALSQFGTSYQMKANSIHRPNLGYGGSDPRLSMNPSSYNYFASLYNQCEVKSSHYKLTYRQTSTTTVNPFIIGVKMAEGSSITDTSYEQLSADTNVKWKIIKPTPDLSVQRSVQVGFKARRRFDTGEALRNVAIIGNDPSDVEYYVPFVQFLDNTSTSLPAMHLTVTCTYYVEFSDPKDIHSFPATAAIDQE